MSSSNRRALRVGGTLLVFALAAGGAYMGLKGPGVELSGGPARQATGREQDALSSASTGRDAAGPGVAAGRSQDGEGETERKRAAEGAALQQREAAAQQQAALDAAKRDLAVKEAEQAANERRLQEEQARIEADKQQAAAEAERLRRAAEAQRQIAEAERARLAAEQAAREQVYQGPSSGEIVWRGEVRGTTLVTIEGNSSDTGEVVSGSLPGVLVMVQPLDGKHVGVAGSPAPSNRFRRLVLRIQGSGNVQEVIHWSFP